MAILYRPLDQDRQEIRLLKQSSSIRSETLEYELIHHTFDQEHPYIALSYAWGQQELRKTIIVDKKTVPVSPNLWAALRSLCDASCAAADEEESSSDRLRRLGSGYYAPNVM
jgi:Heterokaryon incompatibility protein (HET)